MTIEIPRDEGMTFLNRILRFLCGRSSFNLLGRNDVSATSIESNRVLSDGSPLSIHSCVSRNRGGEIERLCEAFIFEPSLENVTLFFRVNGRETRLGNHSITTYLN